MGRPVYGHELTDPDFTWLVNSFRESNPSYRLVDLTSMPLVLILDQAEEEELDPSLPVPFDAPQPKKPSPESL